LLIKLLVPHSTDSIFGGIPSSMRPLVLWRKIVPLVMLYITVIILDLTILSCLNCDGEM
jgi:hypothetical protein